MKTLFRHGHPGSLGARLLVLALCCALTQGPQALAARKRPMEPPKAFKLRLTDPYLSMEVEQREEESTFEEQDLRTRDATLDFTPSVGFSFDGSIYHPSVLYFTGLVEEGLTLGRRELEDDGTTRTDDRNFQLQRYNLSLTGLREKPMAFTLYGSKARDRRDFGDFQRFTTDNESFGLRTGYRRGAVPVSFTAGRWTETVDDPDRPTFRSENTLTLGAESARGDRDRSTATYALNDFRQEEDGEVSNEGTVNTLSLNDAEFFGPNDRNRLFSSLYFNDLSSALTDTRSLNLRESLQLRHYRNLWSEYAYTFDQNSSGGDDSTRHTLEGDLTHKLAASLESKLGALGETISTSGEDGQRTYRYGPRLSETYRKKLRTWGRLRLNAGIDYYRESQSGSSGGRLAVVNEQVRLTDGEPAFLSRPDVAAETVIVTDRSGATLYFRDADYRVVTRGRFTELQRVFGGRIPNGATVSVAYSANAQPSASVTTIDRNTGAELALLDELVVLYATRRSIDSNGGDSLTYQDLDDTVAGARVSRRWFTLGYEHGEHSAEALDYTSERTYQQVSIPIVDGVVVSLEANQSRVEYPEVGDVRKISSYAARYQQQLLSTLWLGLSAGTYSEKSDNNGSRDVRTAEAELNHRYGRLETRCSYRIEDEDNSGEQRDRNWFYLRIVRRF